MQKLESPTDSSLLVSFALTHPDIGYILPDGHPVQINHGHMTEAGDRATEFWMANFGTDIFRQKSTSSKTRHVKKMFGESKFSAKNFRR